MKDEHKRSMQKDLGPGGMNCPCCGPKPGKQRKALQGRARRRLKQADKKLFDEKDQN
jgi:hypothetical protein